MSGEQPSLTADEIQTVKAIHNAVDGKADIDKLAQATGTSRRDILKIAAALGIGTIGGGITARELVQEAQAAASTTDGDGNVGTPQNPVDVFADGISSQTLDTSNDLNDPGGKQHTGKMADESDLINVKTATITLSAGGYKNVTSSDGIHAPSELYTVIVRAPSSGTLILGSESNNGTAGEIYLEIDYGQGRVNIGNETGQQQDFTVITLGP